MGPWRRTAHQWIAESILRATTKPFFRDRPSFSSTGAGKTEDRCQARAQTSQAISTIIDIKLQKIPNSGQGARQIHAGPPADKPGLSWRLLALSDIQLRKMRCAGGGQRTRTPMKRAVIFKNIVGFCLQYKLWQLVLVRALARKARTSRAGNFKK